MNIFILGDRLINTPESKEKYFMHDIADLHCDLLCYLNADNSRTPFDAKVKCSIPQLKLGNVKKQVMAVFSDTRPNSAFSGLKQTQIYLDLQQKFSQFLDIYIAIENASSICEEDEPLQKAFDRVSEMQNQCRHIIYVSMTWNTENRFGGGAHSLVGLKSDGKLFLEYLSGRRVAIDLSHASDALAFDILNTIDQYQLKVPILASHSNFRTIRNVPRNLPDELMGEIIKRGGLIGLNFIKEFVGTEENGDPFFSKQLEHVLNLGGAKNVCFGADFFYEGDLPLAYRKPSSFIPGYDHAGCYGKVINLWKKDLNIDDSVIRDTAFENVNQFLSKNIF